MTMREWALEISTMEEAEFDQLKSMTQAGEMECPVCLGCGEFCITCDLPRSLCLCLAQEFCQCGICQGEGTSDAADDALTAAALETREQERQARIAGGIEHACVACGCSETRACRGGCIWATENLCSGCVR